MKFMSTLVAAASVVVLATSAQAAEQYRLGGGPAGGGWHPAVSAGAALLNSELGEKYNFNYSPSNGSVDNVRRVSLGDFDTAWGHVGQIFQSWNGVGLFEKDGASKDFRLIANVRQQTQIVAVLADSPIKSFSDMKGKIVNLLNKGSGSNVNCRNIMEGSGIISEIEVRNLGFSDSARALGDRQIDVYLLGWCTVHHSGPDPAFDHQASPLHRHDRCRAGCGYRERARSMRLSRFRCSRTCGA